MRSGLSSQNCAREFFFWRCAVRSWPTTNSHPNVIPPSSNMNAAAVPGSFPGTACRLAAILSFSRAAPCPAPDPKPHGHSIKHLKEQIPHLGVVLDCCHKPSHDLGRQQSFLTWFEDMRDWLIRHGVRHIIVACPNCYKVFHGYGQRTNRSYGLGDSCGDKTSIPPILPFRVVGLPYTTHALYVTTRMCTRQCGRSCPALG